MQKMSDLQELAQKNIRDRLSRERNPRAGWVGDLCKAPARQYLLLVAILHDKVPRAVFEMAIRKGSDTEDLGLLAH